MPFTVADRPNRLNQFPGGTQMEDETNNEAIPSRRKFLRGAAALGVGGGIFAACGSDDDTSSADTTTTAAPADNGTETTAAPADSGGDIPSIKIGYVTPRSGPLAAFGEADTFVVAAMSAALGANVEIIDKDAESDPAKAGEVTQELISEGVDVILAGGTPDISVPVAATCDLGEVPCITMNAPWQPHYLGLGGGLGPDFPEPPVASAWNHHFFWGLEDVIANFIELWDQSGAAKVVGALWANDPDGLAWSDPVVGFPPALEAAGYELIDVGRFDLATQDYSAFISQFKDAGCEIISGNMPPPVFATYQSQALQQDFNPPVVTVGKALLFPSAVETFPKGEGLSSEIWWTNRHPFTSSLTGQSCAELAEEFEAATSAQWTQPLGYAHAVFEVAIDAVKRAGTADKEALQAAIGETNLDTMVGNVNFAGGPVPQLSKTPLVAGQWVPGTDYPLELAINTNTQLPALPVDGPIVPIV
jgi:branched-chain amino acid transport system substrate-binding protein